MVLILLALLMGFPGGMGPGVQFEPSPSGGTQTQGDREAQYLIPDDFWFSANLRTDGACDDHPLTNNNWAQWYLGDNYLDTGRAWTITTGDDNLVVAILDLEVLVSHPDLAGNIWENTVETGGIPGVDDDGNGLIDDFNGWDFIAWDNTPYPDVAHDGADIYSFQQHGTQMAGLMGAQGDNEAWTAGSMTPNKTTQKAGVAGVCWDMGILPVTVFSSYTGHADPLYTPGEPGISFDLGVEYICYMKDSGAVDIMVANISSTQCTYYAISRLVDSGIIPVVSLYNEEREFNWGWNPAATSDSVITCSGVQANYSRGGYWIRSGQPSYGVEVDVSAYTGNTLEWWYDYGTGDFMSLAPEASNRPGLFTLGWEYDGNERTAWNWCSNYLDDGLPVNEVIPMVRPTGSLSSGSAAITSGTLILLQSYFDDTIVVLKDRLIRGCFNIDEYNTSSGAYYDGEQWFPESAEGKLGAGAIDAYRSLTLWGTVRDTSLSGDVYVSGDVVMQGTISVADNTTFWIAPTDMYQDEIEVRADCRPGDLFVRNTEPANRLSPSGVCIYVRSLGMICGTNVTFRSWAETPGSTDWEGLHEDGGVVLGSPTVLNAAN